MDFFNVLSCIGGIALFLFGMTYMGEALKKCAGNQTVSYTHLDVYKRQLLF